MLIEHDILKLLKLNGLRGRATGGYLKTRGTLSRHDRSPESATAARSADGRTDHQTTTVSAHVDDAFRSALTAQIVKLESALRELLRSSSRAMSEFDLMQQLSEPPYELLSAVARRSSLGLFQSHFLLFHTLYGIRQKTRLPSSDDKPTRDLCIHALHIGYFAEETPGTDKRRDTTTGHQHAGLPLADCIAHMAGSGAALADYYLELDNLYNTSTNDVNALISGFWKLFRLAEDR